MMRMLMLQYIFGALTAQHFDDVLGPEPLAATGHRREQLLGCHEAVCDRLGIAQTDVARPAVLFDEALCEGIAEWPMPADR